MTSTEKQKFLVRLKVDNSAKQTLAKFSDDLGMSEVRLASAIFQWWGEQPEEFQRAMLGLYGKYGPNIAQLYLEGIAGQLDPKVKIDRASSTVKLGQRSSQSEPASRSSRSKVQ